jgi:hypothetical protein
MARTIDEIQQSIIDAKNADPMLSGLTSTSRSAIWRLWTRVVAFCQQKLESLFDAHKSEVNGILATQRPHRPQWYAEVAKKFRFGEALPADTDTYPDDAAPGSEIVAYAAAVELTNLLRIKVAKVSGAVLAPLSTPELTAFSAYMNRIKDAGVRLQLTSGNPDNLRLQVNVYYDPLVLDNTGARLDGTAASPVKDGINFFLNNLPFNGIFVTNDLIRYVTENVEGVEIFDILAIQANYGSTAFVAFDPQYIPDAGYMVLDAAYFDSMVGFFPR